MVLLLIEGIMEEYNKYTPKQMTRMQAEKRAMDLTIREPRSTGLTFAAKLAGTGWYVAGFYRGSEVTYVRD